MLNKPDLHLFKFKTLDGMTIARKSAFVVAMVATACLFIWFYGSVLDLDAPKTILLRRHNNEWRNRMSAMDAHMDEMAGALDILAARENEVYRSIFGMSPVPDQVKHSGMGGDWKYRELSKLPEQSPLLHTVNRLDSITKQTYIHSKGLEEISAVARTAGDMVSCIPAVSPLMPDKSVMRLSSAFGYRRDPVYGRSEFHQGQDFAARKGTPVYATGDGVVEKAHCQFRGYGNEIVINHGFGYQTRYAHLSTVEVAVGMKVSRGDKIAEVGSTGKSTGSHLHYEVIYMGRRVNPYNYMDLQMPVQEYKAMISLKASMTDNARKSSTSDILNRLKEHAQ